MGNYLSRFLGWPWAQKPRPTRKHCSPSRPLIRSQAREQCKVIYFHGNRWVSTRPLPTAPPGWDYTRIRRQMVPEAWRRFPNRPQLLSNVRPDFSQAHLAYRKRWLWNARHPQPVRSLVTMKIAPLERRGNPAPRPSAFKAVTRNGVARAFVPRPGLVRRCPTLSQQSPKRCSIVSLLPGGRLPRCSKCGRQWPGRRATTGALGLLPALPRHLRLACTWKECPLGAMRL
ncbi:hypothetical protein P7K49_038331 [Saguinus oedipus]|uniref:Uncharacterized protein n=1 Tax=Saguinus oedipus TaxID=9490 RepID=A0ABQ9TEE4_SAGOE|nr:hypothetical protein P7K49_038330 [Saguinus oedipus]KAK2083095.1 hypothetical protein P7K49_038331 [Saguinus oedipus]